MRTGRAVAGWVLVVGALAPLTGALDLLAQRRVVTALIGLVAGGLLAAAGARFLIGSHEEPR